MTLKKTIPFLVLLGLTALFLIALPHGAAGLANGASARHVYNSDQEACGTELLEGTFAYAVQAYTLFPPPSQPPQSPTPIGNFAPFAFAGTSTFDGHGNLEGTDVVNFGFGAIPRTYSGTYSVVDPNARQKQCAFTSTFTDSLHNTVHTYMVLARDGRSLKLVNTDPGFVLTLDAEKK